MTGSGCVVAVAIVAPYCCWLRSGPFARIHQWGNIHAKPVHMPYEHNNDVSTTIHMPNMDSAF